MNASWDDWMPPESLWSFEFSWLGFVLICLATFRLTVLIAEEHGPGQIFSWFRRVAGVKKDQDGHSHAAPGSLAELVTCGKCLSVWMGAGVTILAMHRYCLPIVVMLAASGVIVAIVKIEGLVKHDSGT